MAGLTSREVRLKSRPEGMPRLQDFELATREVRQPGKGEVLVRNLWMSVDPYMRPRMVDRRSYSPPFQIGEVLTGRAIGEVVTSNSPELKTGDLVRNMFGWREYETASASEFQKIIPSLAPAEAYLGVLGMPGLTAYVGLFRIGELKEGDRVFISAAAGAVGSVACQLAKAQGCYVVGSAGSDEKCHWLETVAGIDQAINYKSCGNLEQAVAAAFPDGIDLYFENVGGAHLDAALANMNSFGRIPLCGVIGQYNDAAPPPGPANIVFAIRKSLKLRGFIVTNHGDLMPEFQARMEELIAAGKMKWQQTEEHGIENAAGAFIKLFTGENTGKMLVKL